MRSLAEIDLAHLRIGSDLLRRALGQDGTLDKNGDSPRKAKYEIHIVLNDQKRELGGQALDHIDNSARFARRHARRRLIEQQYFRLQSKRHRNLDQTLPPVGDFAHRPQRVRRDAELLEERMGLFDDGAARASGPEQPAGNTLSLAHRQRDVLENGEAAEKLIDLEGARQSALDALRLRQMRHVATTQQNAPRGRFERTGDQVDKARFPGAVWPDQGVTRAARQAEIDRVGDRQSAEALAKPARLKREFGLWRWRAHRRRAMRRMSASIRPRTPPRAKTTTRTSKSPTQKYQ